MARSESEEGAVVGPAAKEEGPHDAILSTREHILHPKRIEALSQCDTPPYNYHRYSMLRDYAHLGGRNTRMLLPPLILLLLWGIMWNVIFAYADPDDTLKEIINSWGSLITPLWIPISFLMVFRLQRAAIRFWDARAAMGQIIWKCRDAASTAAQMLDAPHLKTSTPHECDVLLDKYARWLAAFPVAVKNYLRSKMDAKIEHWGDEANVNHRRDELAYLLDDDDARRILTADHGVLVVLDRLRALAYEICFVADIGLGPVADAELIKQMNGHLDGLSGAFGIMERIASTPLPFVYVIHLRTFLLVYLLLLNVFSIAGVWVDEGNPVTDGWAVLIALFCINWAMLGLEAASVECERPFGYSSNHLPLAKYCLVIGENIVQTLDEMKQYSGTCKGDRLRTSRLR